MAAYRLRHAGSFVYPDALQYQDMPQFVGISYAFNSHLSKPFFCPQKTHNFHFQLSRTFSVPNFFDKCDETCTLSVAPLHQRRRPMVRYRANWPSFYPNYRSSWTSRYYRYKVSDELNLINLFFSRIFL